MQEITQKLIQSLFEYRNGELFWKKLTSKNSPIQIGDKAGTLHHTGYYQIRINNKNYKTHRLIFLYHHGYLPEFIDHIDQEPLNNNISNLRPATRSQNGMNRKSYKNSSSKYKGVYWRKGQNKWVSNIRYLNKLIYLGIFKNELDAAIAYNEAATKYFGKYTNLNEIGDD